MKTYIKRYRLAEKFVDSFLVSGTATDSFPVRLCAETGVG